MDTEETSLDKLLGGSDPDKGKPTIEDVPHEEAIQVQQETEIKETSPTVRKRRRPWTRYAIGTALLAGLGGLFWYD